MGKRNIRNGSGGRPKTRKEEFSGSPELQFMMNCDLLGVTDSKDGVRIFFQQPDAYLRQVIVIYTLRSFAFDGELYPDTFLKEVSGSDTEKDKCFVKSADAHRHLSTIAQNHLAP